MLKCICDGCSKEAAIENGAYGASPDGWINIHVSAPGLNPRKAMLAGMRSAFSALDGSGAMEWEEPMQLNLCKACGPIYVMGLSLRPDTLRTAFPKV